MYISIHICIEINICVYIYVTFLNHLYWLRMTDHEGLHQNLLWEVFFNLGVSFNTELLHEDFQGAFCVFFSFSYSFTHTYHPSSFLHFQRNEEEIKWESNCVQEKCSTSRFGCFVLFLISFLPIVCFSVISKDTDRYVGRWDSTENDKQKGGGLCTVVLHLT